jgi:dTDP-4-amino-4,6-dideoxygalactose transaminase
MAEIKSVCERHRLALIEDACHAVGGCYLDAAGRPPHGKRAGALGDIGCFSFFSNKNLATGEGGMVTTDRDDLAGRLRLLRSHGMTSLTWDRHRGHASSYDVLAYGFNYRMDELRAALGRCQLQRLEQGNRLRGERVTLYRRRLADLLGWVVPFADAVDESAYHLMVAVAPEDAIRNRVVRALKEAGIQTSLHYPCIPDFAAFAAYRPSGLERSRAFARRAVTLPLYPGMTVAQVEEVCATIREVVTASRTDKR